MDVQWWPHLISMPLYFGFLLWVISFFRKHYKLSAYFWIASLATFPLWILSGGVEGWFRWFKILSVILPLFIVGMSRIAVRENRTGPVWDILKKRGFLWFFYGILFLNIAEASVKDFQLGNYFNALTGLFLCLTIPYVPKFWKITKDGGADLIAYTTVGWNLLYTTWNAAFVFAEDPVHFGSTMCILLAAEIYPIIKRRPELYVTSRIYTLAAHLLIRACYDFFPQVMNTESWYNADFMKWWGIVNFLAIVPFMFWYTWQLDTGKSIHSFRRGTIDDELDKINGMGKYAPALASAEIVSITEVSVTTVTTEESVEPADRDSDGDIGGKSDSSLT